MTKDYLEERHGEEQRDVDAGELLNHEQEEENRERLIPRRLQKARPFGLLLSVAVDVLQVVSDSFLVVAN